MNIVLLSGGIGKRLWPLSNPKCPKQYLKILTKEKNQLESMLQRTWRQLKENQLDYKSIIVTNEMQIDLLKSQISEDAQVITEPENRDTFAAIALASMHFFSNTDANKDTVITILPVDSYVDKVFFQTVKRLEEILISSNSNLALIGAKPKWPSEKYGYIVPEKSSSDHLYFHVSHFKEKPSINEARKLLEKQSYWNCGVFSFKLSFIISMLEDLKLPTSYDALLNRYHNIPRTSFDYMVVERTKNIICVPYDGMWKDLGTWESLAEDITEYSNSENISINACENTHIINNLDVPLTVNGIDDAVVVATHQGILVTSKKENS
ncbi:sugar phosphate nucleotidyltransferase [Bacillus sp. SD088]|uniref:sugar phosphate nucleotidyltransferase n=1 Tax=Bacillus sp. SD088 TaxID=2782012 RepID=UPI001A97AE89|nr:sugar phosphate nucleotidyltransferase [Bacillus sp. SD088]MBO0995919.1 hypothetical protein [Bacillus sp. SD088]